MKRNVLTPCSPLDSLFARSRTFGNIVGGSIAGLLGLTGRDGAAFYIALSIMISTTIVLKTSLQPYKYLTSPVATILTSGLFDRNALLTYILFWTMLFSFN